MKNKDRKAQAKASIIHNPAPNPPIKRGHGRPKTAQPPPPSAAAPTLETVTNSSTPPNGTKRQRTQTQLFRASGSPCGKPRGTNSNGIKRARNEIKQARNERDLLKLRCQHYIRCWRQECAEMSRMLRLIRPLRPAEDDDDDSFMVLPPPDPPNSDLSIEQMKAVFKAFETKYPQHDITNTLHQLGLLHHGTVSKENDKERLRRGITTLMQCILNNRNETQSADMIGEIFFHGLGFSPATVKEIGMKIATPITTSEFSAVCLLRSIDSNAGALNDSAIDQYSKVQSEEYSNVLLKRWRICPVRKIANSYCNYQLDVKHNPDSKYGDHVSVDTSRAFRFMIDAHGLREKATSTNGSVQCCITGDGAAITTGTNIPGQTCIGFKVVDEDAIDPCTNEPEFYDDTVDDNGNITRLYKNAQSAKTCVPLAVCLSKETDELLVKSDDGFMSIFRWCQECSVNGLPLDGDEPVLNPIELVGTGDMSWQRKLVNSGGACKLKKALLSLLRCAWRS